MGRKNAQQTRANYKKKTKIWKVIPPDKSDYIVDYLLLEPDWKAGKETSAKLTERLIKELELVFTGTDYSKGCLHYRSKVKANHIKPCQDTVYALQHPLKEEL